MKRFLLIILMATQAVASGDADFVTRIHALPKELRFIILERTIQTPHRLCQIARVSKEMKEWSESDAQWQRFKLPYDAEVFEHLIRQMPDELTKLYKSELSFTSIRPFSIKLQNRLDAFINRNRENFKLFICLIALSVHYAYEAIYIALPQDSALPSGDEDIDACQMLSKTTMVDLLRYTKWASTREQEASLLLRQIAVGEGRKNTPI